ncbi:hypothetical protein HOY82DRAFT_536330 [Tuber indicum]|nr:hypothetical protein HOY82DRAFT_536330 [Tuber indicum]
MPPIPPHPIETLPLPVEKYGYGGDKGAGGGNDEGPVAILGVVVASLTLLVAIMSLQSSRFRRWASHLLPRQSFKNVYPPLLTLLGYISHINSDTLDFAQKSLIIAPPNIAPTTITIMEDPHAIPVLGIPVPYPIFICNLHFDAHPLCRHTNTPPCDHAGIIGEDDRVPQTVKSLGAGRYEVSSKMDIFWRY